MKLRIFDIDGWKEVAETIKRNKKRSIMTALGVFWGTFMLVVLLGAGMGLGNFFKSSLGDMSTNSCYIFNGRTSIPYKGMPSQRWWNLNTKDIDNISRLDGVKYVSSYNWPISTYGSYMGKKGQFSITGCDSEYQQIDPQTIIAGRFINKIDDQTSRKVCVIGTQVQKELFDSADDAIGKTILLNNTSYMVVGVSKRASTMVNIGINEQTIIIPSSLYRKLYAPGNTVGCIIAVADDDVDIIDFEKRAKAVIAENHLISPDDEKAVESMNLGELFGKFAGLFSGIFLLTWVVGIGTLFAGLIGVSNIMLVVVKERTQEIGVRRAIGARPSVIITQILSESFVLTFIAGIIGLTCAVGVLSVVDSIVGASMEMNGEAMKTSFQISFSLGMFCTAIIVAGSIAAGIIPANRAMTIKAVDALREE